VQPFLTPSQQQIADDHVAVAEGLRRIEVELARLGPASRSCDERAGLRAELVALHALLREHFAREERDDFLGQGIPWDPGTRAAIDQLVGQHRRFLATLERLLAELDRPGAAPAPTGELQNLFANLRWHDGVETGLLRKLAAGHDGPR